MQPQAVKNKKVAWKPSYAKQTNKVNQELFHMQAELFQPLKHSFLVGNTSRLLGNGPFQHTFERSKVHTSH
jgi:hypothetical protein